ncbi:SDR family oxidoreductase [Aquabacterium sp. OR-4]|uniref:SDR family oxidoreductase n=1 Tax=Aquabacterium sp. OR-4 TaxID=2978127 RepID=UPI0021B2C1A4|nr:SDR family oxidoreductase [Aquabacterium sp. OR-4]MDT7836734.1 SDR family oxidoreductase [Aquabacterium sp. OR-4]
MELKDKVIVVTGGASGIGAAACRRFAQEQPAAIVVADRDEAGAAAVAASLVRHTTAQAVRCDVGVEAEVQALVAQATARFGRVDVFFANAGIALPGGLEAPDEAWQRCWNINLMAHVYAARAVVPQMVARGEGYFVSTASAAGLLSHVDSPTYAVTKHGAVAFAEWLAINHGHEGLRVSCLCPQGVRTPMLMGAEGQRKSFLQDGMLEPEQVADEIVRVMQAERFLILPHPEVADYVRHKAADIDRWLGGMRKVKARSRAVQGG